MVNDRHYGGLCENFPHFSAFLSLNMRGKQRSVPCRHCKTKTKRPSGFFLFGPVYLFHCLFPPQTLFPSCHPVSHTSSAMTHLKRKTKKKENFWSGEGRLVKNKHYSNSYRLTVVGEHYSVIHLQASNVQEVGVCRARRHVFERKSMGRSVVWQRSAVWFLLTDSQPKTRKSTSPPTC